MGNRRDMRKVILDTNFLLIPFKFKIDVFEEIERVVEEPHEILVPSGVIGELLHLQKNRGALGRSANFAFTLLEKMKAEGRVKEIESKGDVDGWIGKFASENEGAIVCTNDICLKKTLQKMKLKTIVLRERGYLALV